MTEILDLEEIRAKGENTRKELNVMWILFIISMALSLINLVWMIIVVAFAVTVLIDNQERRYWDTKYYMIKLFGKKTKGRWRI